MIIAAAESPTPAERRLRAALFAAWLVAALVLVLRHVFWRDEIRAFSLALSGDSVIEMLRRIHGEGHPALWYLLLRGAHILVPVREVLPAVGLIVSAGAMALLAFRAPFRPLVIAAILFGAFGLFEYTAVARNYGIAMLVLFALAHLYPRYRDRGATVGALLALLCNTNVPSALLGACFLLFWLAELVGEEGLRWGPKYRLFLLNAMVAAAGALLCFLTVFPTVHDAAVVRVPGGITPGAVATALFFPAYSFWDLMPDGVAATYAIGIAFGLLMLGAMLGLARAPGALLSALCAFAGFELFFQLVYPGYYRHQCLFLVYLIAMYWLAARGRGGRWPTRFGLEAVAGRFAVGGGALFALLLVLQVVTSAQLLAGEFGDRPYSRARDLARLLARERLRDAVLIADPDMFLEAMPYYTANPLYLMREQRFGPTVRFTRRARLDLTPDDYLADARALRARTGLPVVIILEHRLDPALPAYRKSNMHVWRFSATPDQVRRFQQGTRRLASFGPAVTDETYDVYLLTGASGLPSKIPRP